MVSGEHCNLCAAVDREQGAAVPHIRHEYHVIDNKYHDGARARPLRAPSRGMPVYQRRVVVLVVLLPLKVGFHHDYEVALAVLKPLDQGLAGVSGEVFALNHIVVQVVSQVFCAHMPTMSVKDPKEADLRPLALPSLGLGLEYVQDYADSVFIVLSNDPLVSICRICLHYSAFLIAGLSDLVILELEGLRIELDGVLPKEQSLYIHELHIRVVLLLLYDLWGRLLRLLGDRRLLGGAGRLGGELGAIGRALEKRGSALACDAAGE